MRNTNMAAVLTEGGFVTNTQDAYLLRSSAFIREAARAHADAIAAIFSIVQRRSSGGSGGSGGSGNTWTGQVLRNGDRGPLVRSLQEQLLNLGYNLGSFGADGIFGNVTENVVREVQRNAGISVDGVAGPQTYQEIRNARPSGLLVIVDVDTLNVRNLPSWEASALAGTVRRGEAFTVVDRVSVPGSSTDMYRLKSGLYITASDAFVRTRST
ncbi:peptidoglycan-binding domain-containing protein [Alteribacter aurantiacus]|uniref:peptidoglycan-binding domain-containing protein n=1 Tax=Alteribacter aurantiacus TaxID=254410 RepID=UPI0006854DF4|nr:peptidoglycan-binding protein [Alteribacter aurantiacus]